MAEFVFKLKHNAQISLPTDTKCEEQWNECQCLLSNVNYFYFRCKVCWSCAFRTFLSCALTLRGKEWGKYFFLHEVCRWNIRRNIFKNYFRGKKRSRAFPKKKKKQQQKHPRTKEHTQFNQIDHNLICRWHTSNEIILAS